MIDRKRVLWGITNDEDKLFLSRMCDLAQKADTTGRIMYSRFLNPAQQYLVRERLAGITEVSFFGGFDDADRTIAAFGSNEWEEPVYPIRALNVVPTSKKAYSHRDYLGSILALGIDRELTGDIVITENGACVFVLEDIAEFISINLMRVANATVKISFEDNPGAVVSGKQFKETSVTVSSLRFDCVLSAAANKSRSISAQLIEEGLATVNYEVIKNTSHQIKDGDIISLRGYGKVIAQTDGMTTKKGRIHLNLKKYI